MPLPAARRREVRASRRDEPNYPTKRCLNCPKFFKQTKPHKKFCSMQCKDQFNKFGGAYGKLKEKLFAEIAKQVREETQRELQDLNDVLTGLCAHVEVICERVGLSAVFPVPTNDAARSSMKAARDRTASPEVKKK